MEPSEKQEQKKQRSQRLWNRLRTALYYEKRANRRDKFHLPVFPQKVAIRAGKPYIDYFLDPSDAAPFLSLRKIEGTVTKQLLEDASRTLVDVTGAISSSLKSLSCRRDLALRGDPRPLLLETCF